jgi:hypothetical protein
MAGSCSNPSLSANLATLRSLTLGRIVQGEPSAQPRRLPYCAAGPESSTGQNAWALNRGKSARSPRNGLLYTAFSFSTSVDWGLVSKCLGLARARDSSRYPIETLPAP